MQGPSEERLEGARRRRDEPGALEREHGDPSEGDRGGGPRPAPVRRLASGVSPSRVRHFPENIYAMCHFLPPS